jgi:hypothetical protein
VVSKQLTTLVASPKKVTVEVPQPSVVVTEEISGAGTGVLQPGNATVGGQVMVGGVKS